MLVVDLSPRKRWRDCRCIDYQRSKRLYAYAGADPFSRTPVKMKCPCTDTEHGGESCDGDPSGKLFPSSTRTFGCSTHPVSCKIPFPHKPGAELVVSGWASFAEAYHVHSNPHATDHAPQVALSAITVILPRPIPSSLRARAFCSRAVPDTSLTLFREGLLPGTHSLLNHFNAALRFGAWGLCP